MNYIYKYLWVICFTMTLYCCSDSKSSNEKIAFSDLPVVTVQSRIDSIIEIKNWLAIGPFEFNRFLTDPVKSFFRDDLKQYGIKEGTIDSMALEKLQKKGASVFLINSPSSQIKIIKYLYGSIKDKSNIYLVTQINSAKAQEATLIIDGSYSYAVWLNGNNQIEIRGKYNTNKVGDRFVNVSLKEGNNTLIIKVNRGSNERSWDLICALSPRKEAERIFNVNYSGDFVVNPIINDFLEIYAGPYRSGKIEILDSNNQIIAGNSFNDQNTNFQPFAVQGLKKLEDGFYKTVMTVSGARLEEMIYKGDYKKFVKKIKARVADIKADSLYVDDLNAAMQRVKFLNNKSVNSYSQSETRYLNRNRVFWGYSLCRLLKNNALTQLMTYKNEDANSDVFIFHNGREREGKVPLVIIVPYAIEGNSMINDWYASNLDQIETDDALADEHGFAVAWIYAGGRQYSFDRTNKEIAAIIDRLSSEGIVDRTRIFITGDCEGGRRALLQLAATPDRYAACAVSSPITLSGEGSDRIPIHQLSKMGNVPIFIEQGLDDNVSPVENSRRFYTESQKLNMPVEYVEVKGGHASLSKDNHRDLFEFFSRVEFKQK